MMFIMGMIILLVCLNLGLLLKIQKDKENTSRPYLLVGYELEPEVPSEIYFYLENVGQTAAINVSLQLEIPLPVVNQNRTVEEFLSQPSLEFLVPGYKASIYLNNLSNIKEENGYPLEQSAVIRYSLLNGKEYEEKHRLDIRIYQSLVYATNRFARQEELARKFRDDLAFLRKEMSNLSISTGNIAKSLKEILNMLKVED